MMQTVTIVLDTLGGDKGPAELLKGAAEALRCHPELSFVFSGDPVLIRGQAGELAIPSERFEILEAPVAVTQFDHAADALFQKTESSMLKGLRTLGEREDLFGIISCGNTGVLLPGAVRYLSGAKRVRPAMAALLPAETGGFVCLVDAGATIDCSKDLLLHFAHLGSSFMARMYGIERPRVGLLSNGAEPTKGNALVKETHPALAEDPEICFVGNIEGSRALSGDCDVLVCDGFAGNQVLKVTEGTARRILTDIARYAKKTGSADALDLFRHLMGVYDISSLGGGILLGVEKPVLKARGDAGAQAVISISQMLLNMAQNKAVFDEAQNQI